jgi:hypothetical protein
MKTAYDEFINNLTRVRNLGTIYSSLSSKTAPILDISDILRAELVLAVSSFDHYIHKLVLIGMLEEYFDKRPKTPHFLKFKCSINSIITGYNDPQSQIWLETEIRTTLGFQSFLQPDKLSESLKLISEKNVWQEISGIVHISSRDLQSQLNLIVDRRNKIAHEADRDPSYPDKLWPINEQLVNDAIEFLEILGENIFLVVI